PQNHCVAAEVDRQGEGPPAARRRRQGRQAARIGLERDVPSMVHPRRMRDTNLAQHLSRQVEDGKRLVIALDAELGPLAHRVAVARSCILLAAPAEGVAMADPMSDRIAATKELQELDSVRVSLLGKSGEITAKLKSLGSMDADTRTAEAPRVHALREAVTEAI